MSSIGLVTPANSAVLAQIQRLNEVVADGQKAQADFTVKLAKLTAEQAIEQQKQSATEQALDVVA